MLYLVVIVVIRSGESLKDGVGTGLSFLDLSESIFRSIPIITLAFTCQVSRTLANRRLQDLQVTHPPPFLLPSADESVFHFQGAAKPNPPAHPQSRDTCVWADRLCVTTSAAFNSTAAFPTVALTVCMVLYLLVGTFGYLTFYEWVTGVWVSMFRSLPFTSSFILCAHCPFLEHRKSQGNVLLNYDVSGRAVSSASTSLLSNPPPSQMSHRRMMCWSRWGALQWAV